MPYAFLCGKCFNTTVTPRQTSYHQLFERQGFSMPLNFNVSFVQGARTPKNQKKTKGIYDAKMYVSLQQEPIRLKKAQIESMCLTI